MSILGNDPLVQKMLAENEAFLIPDYARLLFPKERLTPELFEEMLTIVKPHLKQYQIERLCAEALRRYPSHVPLQNLARSIGMSGSHLLTIGSEIPSMDDATFASHLKVALNNVKDLSAFLKLL